MKEKSYKRLEKDDGTSVEEEEDMAAMTQEFYSNLFTSEGTHNMHEVLDKVPTKVMNDMLEA